MDQSCLSGVAVDDGGKIYVVDSNFGRLTTYKPNGNPTTPSMSLGYNPGGVAVDENGKIYITDSPHGMLKTYNPDGSPTTPTISGFEYPTAVAVDANGKIYVADSNTGTITTYDSDGTPTTPAIGGLSRPTGVAVDANGKIYVAQGGIVTTYAADGTSTTPTLSVPGYSLCAVAVNSQVKFSRRIAKAACLHSRQTVRDQPDDRHVFHQTHQHSASLNRRRVDARVARRRSVRGPAECRASR